ncbi:MAG: 4Fe-4S binding protein [Deltaproteobacteria bacterium]|nr:4Fe-4S binding protein [Deltaproteobacteria bacterium]
MPEDIYKKLARHLDELPGGYPPTESGVELRILQRLFTPEEAAAALCTTLIPEEAGVIARRLKKPLGATAELLADMARNGLIYSIHPGEKPPLYMAAQYVVGIWEYHVNQLDEDLIRDMREYMPQLFDHQAWSKSPQIRTIPVQRSLSAEARTLPYEEVETLVAGAKKILVAPCICRREHQIMGDGCDRMVETCLVFGGGADYYERAGIGRRIDAAEALGILRQADKQGLVVQPSNSQKIINICLCCGCCCGILKSLKKHPRPAEVVSSPFVAEFVPDECKACGLCVKRCQMEAFHLEDKELRYDAGRCIGCGLCVSTCPTGSLRLARKPDREQKEVPASIVNTFLNLGKARGKLGPASLAKMQLKSKLDRALALKR